MSATDPTQSFTALNAPHDDGAVAGCQPDQPIGRVVLTHARSLQALVAARSLGQRGVEVIGCDETPLMALSFSRYAVDTFLHPPMTEGPEAFIAGLEEKLRAYRPENPDLPYVLLPVHRHTPLIAEHRDRLESVARVAAPPAEAIRVVDRKDLFVRTAREHGVPIPPSWLVPDQEALQTACQEAEFPVFLKLPDATGGVGVQKAEHPEQLQQLFTYFIDRFGAGPQRVPVVQQAVGEDDYCLTCLCRDGVIMASMAYRNLRTFPAEGGFGVLRETVPAGRLVDAGQRLLSGLRWHGIAEIDFRWDGQEATTPWMLEVNPRFWGGLFQSVESGVDYPWLLYQLTVHGDIDPPGEPRLGTRTKVPLMSLLGAAQELAGDEDRFGRLQATWQGGWQKMQSGRWWQGLQELAASVGQSLDPGDRLQRLQRWLEEDREARSEVLSTEDPMASLGLLYVLGSLMRTGKLPHELNRSGDQVLREQNGAADDPQGEGSA